MLEKTHSSTHLFNFRLDNMTFRHAVVPRFVLEHPLKHDRYFDLDENPKPSFTNSPRTLYGTKDLAYMIVWLYTVPLFSTLYVSVLQNMLRTLYR